MSVFYNRLIELSFDDLIKVLIGISCVLPNILKTYFSTHKQNMSRIS